jgi:hypothetical protein
MTAVRSATAFSHGRVTAALATRDGGALALQTRGRPMVTQAERDLSALPPRMLAACGGNPAVWPPAQGRRFDRVSTLTLSADNTNSAGGDDCPCGALGPTGLRPWGND